jgi:hypothetical protein
MEKKPAKKLKSLRLRKEILKPMTTDQLGQVQGGGVVVIAPDPWDPPPPISATCV